MKSRLVAFRQLIALKPAQGIQIYAALYAERGSSLGGSGERFKVNPSGASSEGPGGGGEDAERGEEVGGDSHSYRTAQSAGAAVK